MSDAVAVCEQVAGRPAVVIGHSLGGGAAAALAQQRPDLVRAVVLEDPALAGATEIGDNSLREGFAMMRDLIPQVQASGMAVDDLVAAVATLPNAATGRTLGEDLCPDAIRSIAEGVLALDATVLDVVLDGTLLPPFDPAEPIPVPGILVAADPASSDAVAAPGDPRGPRPHQPPPGGVGGARSDAPDPQLGGDTRDVHRGGPRVPRRPPGRRLTAADEASRPSGRRGGVCVRRVRRIGANPRTRTRAVRGRSCTPPPWFTESGEPPPTASRP